MERKRFEEPDKDIVDEMVESLEKSKSEFVKMFDDAIQGIREAGDIDSIMKEKKFLLKDIVKALPLGISSCYFCLEGFYETKDLAEYCHRCKYGAEFGQCIIHPYSTWRNIMEKKSELLDVIRGYWFNS